MPRPRQAAEHRQPPGRTFCGLVSGHWACWVTFRWPSPSHRQRPASCGVCLAVALGQAGVDGASMVTGVRDVQDSRMSFLSRSGLARPNSCILRALILLTVPSTAPEL